MNRLVLPTFVVCLRIVGQECVESSCGDKCCAFFYKQDGKCIACPNGTSRYTEDSEYSCTTCVGIFYGWRCLNTCTCTPNERCDNVYGCVQTQTSTTAKYQDPPATYQDSPVQLQDRANYEKSHTIGTTSNTTEGSVVRKVFFSLSHTSYYGLVIGVPAAITLVLITVFLVLKIVLSSRRHDIDIQPNQQSVVANDMYTSPVDIPMESGQLSRFLQSFFDTSDSSEWSGDSSHGNDIYVNDDYSAVQNLRSDNSVYNITENPDTISIKNQIN